MNQIEELVEQHARAVRALSRAMDLRNDALSVWSRSKSESAVAAYHSADRAFQKAALHVRDLRVAIAQAQGERNFEERFAPLPAHRKLARR